MRNSYPIDSAEGAVRSALTAVVRLHRDLRLGSRRIGPACGSGRLWGQRDPQARCGGRI
jgi:hypothetical protein